MKDGSKYDLVVKEGVVSMLDKLPGICYNKL